MTGIVILAAGASVRMKQSKQMLLVRGEPLLTKSARIAVASNADHVVVVISANQEEHQHAILHLPVKTVHHVDSQNGIGSSLKYGLRELLTQAPRTDAVIFMVCDQPLLTADHLNKIMDEHQSTHASIVASRYQDTLGVPALFHKQLFPELLNIPDTHGAKAIIQQQNTDVHIIDFPEGSIDLDTPDEYDRFTNR